MFLTIFKVKNKALFHPIFDFYFGRIPLNYNIELIKLYYEIRDTYIGYIFSGHLSIILYYETASFLNDKRKG